MTDPILERDPVLQEIVRRLVAAYEPERIYLFGSKARGEAGPDSDYDLLVVVSASDAPPYRRAQEAQEILWGIWTAADVLVLTRDEFDARRAVPSSLAASVLREGRVLHAA
ncbi:nucleotidyltransferase domain-containing protein [Nitrospira sp. Kam-Ns4a]